jgi:hypothetical protein
MSDNFDWTKLLDVEGLVDTGPTPPPLPSGTMRLAVVEGTSGGYGPQKIVHDFPEASQPLSPISFQPLNCDRPAAPSRNRSLTFVGRLLRMPVEPLVPMERKRAPCNSLSYL